MCAQLQKHAPARSMSSLPACNTRVTFCQKNMRLIAGMLFHIMFRSYFVNSALVTRKAYRSPKRITCRILNRRILQHIRCVRELFSGICLVPSRAPPKGTHSLPRMPSTSRIREEPKYLRNTTAPLSRMEPFEIFQVDDQLIVTLRSIYYQEDDRPPFATTCWIPNTSRLTALSSEQQVANRLLNTYPVLPAPLICLAS